MTSSEFFKIIEYITQNCRDLKNKYISEDLKIDYVCIFSKSQKEFDELLKFASSIGELAEQTKTGPVFKLNNSPDTIIGKPKMLKIRIPDKTRLERGDVDFNTDYENFKKKYLDNKRFTLIKRDNFEMLELRDNSFDVLVYFSSIPLSEQLGVN
ncbi:MAG: hypothetical protein US96_C0034G0008 [Candidatus Woesebacteria bacterium GW2011_GWB1_38_5b]|uniref:Uncharacterized protein n=1 Tax=Candidatus Woesebacteria bacterium GW2011_GWB1_38_5b TaxID=1618569 RepID=A0A0G0K691_9BACT|nr:MAG: hypothetical protein US96_C0034G0008 [Candidatus Woesebacteria bacterium GW2011_GWB1_38_5b]OGH47914.1 MAG: hypothetical protein A3A51_00235 [Candidatus Levybacteria bacterium RIFCSPLOWO2_01_FULL_39_10]